MEKNSYFLHSLELRCQLAYVHSDVLGENRWTKRSSKMILDEHLSALVNCNVVDQVHLSNWEPNFWIYNLFQFASYLVDRNQIWTKAVSGVDSIYTLVTNRDLSSKDEPRVLAGQKYDVSHV